MVLESVVSALLSKYLGDYVDGLSTDNLSLGIFSGEVVLENLALKRSALAGLHLPVTVKAGYLGTSMEFCHAVRW
jgi:vacuolar protein sorting-associated protein 13A/C